MKSKPIKIGIAGTHSTGKSTFLAALAKRFKARNFTVGLIGNLAQNAIDLGFPVFTKHTFESTLWIMAECMRREAEASLTCDVILVDRPVLDALGYFKAALEVSGRTVDPKRIKELEIIARAHSTDYDMLVVTSLDLNIPLGERRDPNMAFRQASARHIDNLVEDFAPKALRLTSTNALEIIEKAGSFAFSRLPARKMD